jgi:bifunctional DNA-binding transcriptional regulator/antitoxin component of YhaV-PrlF toxin-antitoxin module
LGAEVKKEEAKTFTAHVQVGYRIQIPEAIRVVLGINEGDFVDVTIKKVTPKPPVKEAEKGGEG